MDRFFALFFLFAFVYNTVMYPWWGLPAYFALGGLFWGAQAMLKGQYGIRIIFTWFPELAWSMVRG